MTRNRPRPPIREFSRRRFLRAGGALALGALAGCAGTPNETTTDTTRTGSADGTTGAPSGVGTELVADGFTAPVGVEFPPGDTTHAFVVDQAGVVHVVGPDGVRDDPFLDVRDRMVDLGGYEERGLLGLAFHPNYAENGRVFARYSAPLRDSMHDGYSHAFVLSEFRADGLRAPADTERVVLEIPEPQSNHNAGAVTFGPDDFLYVAVGDGGGANDTGTGHVQDWYAGNDGGNGQDTAANLLGSILRLDVDAREDGKPYGIPNDNPLVGRSGLDEHYAWGFRNPWRMSFTGNTFYVADVGQNRWEEVNVVEAGGNYGWNVREGAHCFDANDCPTETPNGDQLIDPVIEYPHSGGEVSGISVIGGYEYTGDAVPALDGLYVFGDWRANGTLFTSKPQDGDGLWPIHTVDLAPTDGAPPGQYLLGFGRDHSDELYVATTNRTTPTGSTGAVHRLVAADE